MKLTAEIHGHYVVLITESGIPLTSIGVGNIDEAIEALCALRFEQDPAVYEDFITRLLPKFARTGERFVFRDLGNSKRISFVDAKPGVVLIDGDSLTLGAEAILDED
jgi:hypothetical protein